MIFSLDEQTVLRDLRTFLSLTADRQARFDAAPDVAPAAAPRVNLQQERLHPALLQMQFCGGVESPNGVFFCDFRGEPGAVPPFSPGQTARVYCGRVSHPIQLASAPAAAAAGEYRFGVSAGSQPDAHAFFTGLSVGETVGMRAPGGSFRYLSIRDKKKLALVVDASGLPTAAAFAVAYPPEGGLTVSFYCVNCERESFFDDRFRIVDSAARIAETGEDTSVFVCGSAGFCDDLRTNPFFVDARFQPVSQISRPVPLHRTFPCTVRSAGGTQVVPCDSDAPLLASLEAAGVRVPAICSDGGCGFCRMKLISGSVTFCDPPCRDPRRMSDAERSVIHACRTFPDSDLTVLI